MLINLYLFWGAWQDIQRRKITNTYLWAGGMGGIVNIVVSWVSEKTSFGEWLGALIPGIILLAIAKITGEKIGMGDGWIIIILGNFLNMKEIWYLIHISVMIIFLFSIILLFTKKVGKEYQIPFLPFIWIAHTFMWGLHYV